MIWRWLRAYYVRWQVQREIELMRGPLLVDQFRQLPDSGFIKPPRVVYPKAVPHKSQSSTR